MAETLLSPGVLARENDQSFVTSQPLARGAAIIGPTVKGPVEIPTLVSSFSSFQAIFGGALESGSNQYSYLTSISANNYFQNGGESLLVTRVVSGSFTPATSSAVITEDNPFSNNFNISASIASFTINNGTFSGSVGAYTEVPLTSSTGNGDGATVDITIDAGGSGSSAIQINLPGENYSPGDILTIDSSSISDTADGVDLSITLPNQGTSQVIGLFNYTSSFELETISEGIIMDNDSGEVVDGNGALISGSEDNVRWEVTNVNSGSGVFSLIIRRGNDNNNQKVVLESYNNVSLDPFANNYISRVIGDVDKNLVTQGGETFIQESGSFPNISNYVRVKAVNKPTPNYFNNDGSAKSEFFPSLPLVSSGSFGGASGSNIPGVGYGANGSHFYQFINNSNAQGLKGSDYNNAIALLANTDAYQYNVITIPGLINANSDTGATQITSLVNNTVARGDAIAIVDLVNYNSQIGTVTQQAASFDSSYASTYWPWVQTVDPNTAQLVYVPASTLMPGVYAFTDASSDPWFAPAGITRGGLGQVVRAERKLTSGNRDTLYEANVNPLATFPQQGVVVFGQKTLQKAASALDRVNVRRLLIALKDFISQIADNLVFEQNTIATRQNFLTQVNPYLESVQQRQGLYAFKVVMDESNNTPDVIDRNELIGQIFLQPTKTAEFIILDFNVLPTGATFPA